MSTCNRLDLQITRISAGDAQKSPRSLLGIDMCQNSFYNLAMSVAL